RSVSWTGWARSSTCGGWTARRRTWCASTTGTRRWCSRGRTRRWSPAPPGREACGGSADPYLQFGQAELLADLVDDLRVVDEPVPALQVGHLVPVQHVVV